MITEPGIYYDVDEKIYHQDPCDRPSLSSSVAKLLISRSPRHAWHAHPKLNRSLLLDVEESTPAKDFGTVVHTLMLGQGRPYKEIAADDYKKKVAQEARDEARAAGMIPILSHRLAAANQLATVVRDQIATTWLAPYFDKGRSEVTLVWDDVEDVRCRARVDWLPEPALAGGHVTVFDIKTTGESAAPADWQRNAFDMGYDIQDDLYRRGLMALIPGVRSVRFLFLVIEQDAPHCLSVHEFGGQARAEAEQLVDAGIGVWSQCLEADKWPGYDIEEQLIAHIDPPKWRSERGEFRRLALQRVSERFFAPHRRAPEAA